MSLLLTFGKKSVIQRAISVLRKYGTDAHAYIQITSVVGNMATSTGPITLATNQGVEVLPNKIWRIV